MSTLATEGEDDGLRQAQESETPEEERLPSFTVTFSGAGIEIVVYQMNKVPLNMIERAQHLLFQKVMQERQREYQAQRLSETKETR